MQLLRNGKNAKENACIILAHGAGAPMDSQAMTLLAGALEANGFQVVRFEFPYMARRREDGKKRPPDPAPRLLAAWREALQETMAGLDHEVPIFIGGKSMGGRMATILAGESLPREVKGCLAFGYPFHPPGKPDRWRTEHFPDCSVPLWIAQGERDPFGRRDEVEASDALAHIHALHWVPCANHDLKPTKSSGLSWEEALRGVAEEARAFTEQVMGANAQC